MERCCCGGRPLPGQTIGRSLHEQARTGILAAVSYAIGRWQIVCPGTRAPRGQGQGGVSRVGPLGAAYLNALHRAQARGRLSCHGSSRCRGGAPLLPPAGRALARARLADKGRVESRGSGPLGAACFDTLHRAQARGRLSCHRSSRCGIGALLLRSGPLPGQTIGRSLHEQARTGILAAVSYAIGRWQIVCPGTRAPRGRRQRGQ